LQAVGVSKRIESRDVYGSNLQPKPPSASRASLAIITDPSQANAFGIIHGGVILRLLDECGALAAFRHHGGASITTATIDGVTFLSPVRVGERVHLAAEITHVGCTSMEARIVVTAEPLAIAAPRKVAVGYGLYVALNEEGRPVPVAPLLSNDEAETRAAEERQRIRLARRSAAQRHPLPPSS
jgi:uncharacterized protein (TIGR00369 family)